MCIFTMEQRERESSFSLYDAYEIYLSGETIRSEMTANGLIRDRKYHLRTYKQCFPGNEAVDWLIRCRHCDNRKKAVTAMRILQDRGFLHHVCDDHKFKDEMLFYRFRRDESIPEDDILLKYFYTGLDIYAKITTERKGIIRKYRWRGHFFQRSFTGSSFVDWLVKSEETSTMEDAINFGRRLLENGVIRHVTDDHHFRNDDTLLYQFTMDYDQKHLLKEVLRFSSEGRGNRRCSNSSRSSADSQESMSLQTKQQQSSWNGHVEKDKIMDISECSDKNITESSESSDSGCTSEMPTHPKSVLLRQMTAEELESPDTPYIKSCLRVFCDSVGYGFVVRGDGPTYVQTVDPTGPAADAGLKVRQYIYSVNGENLLRRNHRDVAKIIMASVPYINICVMTHKRDAKTASFDT